MKTPLTLDQVNQIVSENKLILLSNEYKNYHTKLDVQSIDGYLFSIRLSDIVGIKNPSKFNPKNPYLVHNIKHLIYSCKKYEYISHTIERNGIYVTLKCAGGYIYYTGVHNLKNGQTTRLADKGNPYTIQNINLWLKLNNKPFTLISNKYNNNSENLKWLCLYCNRNFYLSWNCVLRDYNCNECNKLIIKTPELINEWNFEKNINININDISYCSNQKVWWICKKCGHEWKTSLNNRNGTNKTACPACSDSKGEKTISNILNKFNIIFDRQFTFSDCKDKRLLPFDFAIFEDKNEDRLQLLIEFDGQFHYEKQYEGDGHELIRRHDEMKNEYCYNRNIKLLRIPYWELENIESILKKQLKIRR